jgi:TPR repeat protein
MLKFNTLLKEANFDPTKVFTATSSVGISKMKTLLVALLVISSSIANAKDDLDARAQYRLCGMYMDSNAKQAAKYCQLSAAQGLPEAEFRLGWFYEQGIGVAKDSDQSMKWYKSAADHGFLEAQYKLGIKQRPAPAPSVQTKSDGYDEQKCKILAQIYFDCSRRNGQTQCHTEEEATFPCGSLSRFIHER